MAAARGSLWYGDAWAVDAQCPRCRLRLLIPTTATRARSCGLSLCGPALSSHLASWRAPLAASDAHLVPRPSLLADAPSPSRVLWSPVPPPTALKPGAAETPQLPADGGGGGPKSSTAAMDEEDEAGEADSAMAEASASKRPRSPASAASAGRHTRHTCVCCAGCAGCFVSMGARRPQMNYRFK